MTDSGSELLLALQAGDLEAFEKIVERYERPLLRYFFHLSGDAQLAEDCAQEVFVRVFRARETYTPDAALSTFVFRIARNYWIDQYRSRRARPRPASLDTTTRTNRGDEAGNDPIGARVAAEGEAPGARVELDEDLARLRAAVAKLPEGQRAVLELAGAQGMKYEQVAAVLGIPIGTVKSRVHAAVQMLRRLLEEDAS